MMMRKHPQIIPPVIKEETKRDSRPKDRKEEHVEIKAIGRKRKEGGKKERQKKR